MELEPWQWVLGLIGAFLMGSAKGGLPGLGNLTVAIYAMTFDARTSVGILLPVLVAGDIVTVVIYRHHAQWKYIRRLLPWMIVGLVIGYLTLDKISSDGVRMLIGTILLTMTALHFFRKWQLRNATGEDSVPHTLAFRSTTGMIGGFATMVANAAGPVAALYFLAVRLPKMAFIGTSAATFFIVNLTKVPMQAHLGIITKETLALSAVFAPAAIIGVSAGRIAVNYINQRVFELLIWFFIIVAGIDLLFNINMVQSIVNAVS